MERKPISNYLAPGLLVLSTLLAAANWYLEPERRTAWITSGIVLGALALVLILVARSSSTAENASPEARRSANSIRVGVTYAGLMVVVSLGAKLATALGAAVDADFSRRALMAVLGAFLVFTGNSVPKTLAPLVSVTCDAGRLQAFQRFAGWTWVLTGLALALGWLALPVNLAESGTFVLVPASMLLLVVQVVRLRRTGQRPA